MKNLTGLPIDALYDEVVVDACFYAERHHMEFLKHLCKEKFLYTRGQLDYMVDTMIQHITKEFEFEAGVKVKQAKMATPSLLSRVMPKINSGLAAVAVWGIGIGWYMTFGNDELIEVILKAVF
jgi:hypothetical protein